MTGKQGRGTGPRPHTWVTGPDPEHHDKYISWQRVKAQAAYRGEAWDFSFKDYVAVWGDQWHRRGRTQDALQMMRRDFDKPWTRRNVIIVNRTEFHRRQGLRKRQLQAQRKAQKDE